MEGQEKNEVESEEIKEGLDKILQNTALTTVKATTDLKSEKKHRKKTAETAQLREELEKIRGESKENYDKYLRAMADQDNYRKRVKRESTEASQLAKENLILDILPVLDNFKRALNSDHFSKDDNFHRGVEMIYNQFLGVLVEEGLREFEVLGKPFDPSKHEAVATVVSWEHEPETVIEELEPGYMIGERIIRPAKVKVTKGPEPSTVDEPEIKETTEMEGESPERN